MGTTRGGEAISAQIGNIGIIDISAGNFTLNGARIPFNIKNDSETAVFLEVNLWGMKPGTFVNTRFETGWNPEIIREIKQSSIETTLLWGY